MGTSFSERPHPANSQENEGVRLKPLEKESWPAQLAPIRDALGQPLHIHGLLAQHPELLQAWFPFRNHVVRDSSLTDRQRELVILRYAHLSRTEYEWVHHVIRGAEAGLAEEEVERIKAGPQAIGWSEEESVLLTVVDESITKGQVDSATRMRAEELFTDKQLLDVLCTIGAYTTLGLILRTFQVPLESSHKS